MPTPDPSPLLLGVHVLHEDPDTAVVALSGELDIASGPLLHARLDRLLADVGALPSRLVFDLDDLLFADVVGLGELLDVEQRVSSSGGRVLLRRPPPLVRRVLALLDLQDRLPVEV